MDEFHFMNPRPLCPAALGLATGIGLWRLLPKGAAFFSCSLGLLIGIGFFLLQKKHRLYSLFFFLCAIGLLRMHTAAPPIFEEANCTLSGVICEAPAEVKGGVRVTLKNVEVDGTPFSGRVETIMPFCRFSYGQRILAEGTLTPVSASDTNRLYRNISGTFSAAGDFIGFAEKRDLYGDLLSLRSFLSGRVSSLFPKHGGIAAAMLLGEKSGITEEENSVLYDSGIGHLIAVSGLHVSVLAGAVSALIPRSKATLRFLFLSLFLLFYAFITALSPSVLRAGILFLTVELAYICERRYDGFSGLSFAALLILLYKPAALFYAGFQLSFAAVFGLMALSPAIGRLLVPALGDLGDTLAHSLAASLAILPVTLYFFGRLSLFSLAANLIALPLAPLFLIPAAVSLLVSLIIPAAGSLAAFFPSLVLNALFAVGSVFSKGVLTLSSPTVPLMLLYYTGILIVSDQCLLPGKIKYPCGFSAMLCALLCFAS